MNKRLRDLAMAIQKYADTLDDVEPVHAIALYEFTDRLDKIIGEQKPVAYAAQLDLLKTIENNVSQVPPWLWKRIQDVIAKAEEG